MKRGSSSREGEGGGGGESFLLILTHGASAVNNSCYCGHSFCVTLETWMRSLQMSI